MSYDFSKTTAMFERAARVIPRGIIGIKGPSLVVPGSYPLFASHGKGCRYWDVDGNEFIDYLCGYGSCVLGYRDTVVDAAARAADDVGFSFNHPTATMVELAERMVELIDGMDWAIFAKNGSDMTTYAWQVAREHTGRRKILKARGEYHGSHAWSTPGRNGLLDEERAHVHEFIWNDLESIRQQLAAHAGDVAAVIVTPYHHPQFEDSALSENGFLQEICRLAREDGFLVISDDIRVGFRASYHGAHALFDYTPDLTCYSKAIANGYPLAACLGSAAVMPAAKAVFTTGTFWMQQGPMAAALACIARLQELNGVTVMRERGQQLIDGLHQVATRHGERLTITGLPSMPRVRFATETDYLRCAAWCAAATRRGAYFHPYHNWFLTTAHTRQDIERTLDIADAAMAEVAGIDLTGS